MSDAPRVFYALEILSPPWQVLDALADPEHPEHAAIKEWHNGYDPAHIDAIRINFLLGRISNRRAAGRARSPKPQP